MENYYYSEKIFEEQVVTNEHLVDLKENLTLTNTYLNTLLLFIVVISVLISSDMVHHLLDAFYKFKNKG